MPFPDSIERISSPGELAVMLRQIKLCITEGRLKMINPSGAPLTVGDLLNIPDEGPWPDFIEAFFESQQGQKYKLEVETYHGVGGLWTPV
jgi:hypothetical protein